MACILPGCRYPAESTRGLRKPLGALFSLTRR
jgi:hypothetical protein